jgi:hypothetical protein
MVKCCWCDKLYQGFTFTPDRATGCSSFYEGYERLISCHYGSAYDKCQYRVSIDLEDWIPWGGIVCDTCINKWIEEGELNLVYGPCLKAKDESRYGAKEASVKPSMKLVESKFVFQQDNDCCDDGKHDYDTGCQYLTVETHDGGGGVYLTIKTERWALDLEDLETLVERLTQIVKQVHSDVEVVQANTEQREMK